MSKNPVIKGINVKFFSEVFKKLHFLIFLNNHFVGVKSLKQLVYILN